MAKSTIGTVYPFVFLDCMFFKVRVNGTVEIGAIYNILGVDIEGKKDVLGLYTAENGRCQILAVGADRPKSTSDTRYSYCLYRWPKRVS